MSIKKTKIELDTLYRAVSFLKPYSFIHIANRNKYKDPPAIDTRDDLYKI